ncbi:Putative anti-sigma factor antagonist BtrV [Limihaloglobus sulfuriphilus]|uniref:Anti-sigma factor antagonist n=1 Tax=Limihaloglobus sulfuriphilus TaxID=1851148 RepID=A0A1Q2MGK3_9BACT|nr:STAS domain-containing protein [Limihaloglobus sulfuriphilus]AQQ71779.1 Putative anti-sigma factor antagonist BtrV [Limihaloglobus sulfuriphilus]
MAFNFNTGFENHIVRITLKGRLNSEQAHELDKEIKKLLKEHDFETMILDMKELELITSTGIGIIIKVKTYLSRLHKELIMLHMQPQVKKVFEIVHLLPTLNVFEDKNELDSYLYKIQKNPAEEI